MRDLRRHGFTVVELLMALVLMGLVTASVYRVLVGNQQVYLAQTQRIGLQQNIRAAATMLPGELRELDAADGDISAMSATSITIRAMRQLGIICNPPLLGGPLVGLTMTIRQNPFFASRSFNVSTDQLLIYYEGDSTKKSDDTWVPATLAAVSSLNCPDAKPGWRLTMTPTLGAGQNVVGAITKGSPVRGFEVVTYGLYQASDGRWYVGQTKSGTTQPLIGPLAGDNGLTFTYYDSTGTVTAVPTKVASIEIRLRGQTASPVRRPTAAGVGYVTDSLVTLVALRNNVRF